MIDPVQPSNQCNQGVIWISMGRCLADNVDDNLGEDGYEEEDGSEDEDEDADEDKDQDEEIWAQLLLAGSWCFSRSRHMYIHLDHCMSMDEIYS